jgi:hypothetical protein
MKALSDKISSFEASPNMLGLASRAQDFDILKKQRRDNILNIIKKNDGNATIKDIRDKINIGLTGAQVCSEKTLQRELLSMTREGVLNKTGEKRWTKYFLK